MEPVNILDARNRLSQLIAAAGEGADVVIAKRGKPIVRLVAVDDSPSTTAAAAAQWLVANHAPGTPRSRKELDAQIDSERQGWE
jgi:prevent-host-death family protein